MARRTHDPRARGMIRHVIPAPRRSSSCSLLFLYSSSPSLQRLEDSSSRPARMFTFVSSGSLRFTGRCAQRAFYSLASSGRAMDAERIPPSSQPCRGRRQNTHKARLVNYSRRDRPHLHPGSLHRSYRCALSESRRKRERGKKATPVIEWSLPRSSVAATRGNFFVVIQRRQPSSNEERSLCCYDRFWISWMNLFD